MKKNLLCSGIALIMIMSCSKKDNEVPVTAKNQSMLKSTSVDISLIQCNPTNVKSYLGGPNFVYTPPTPPAPQSWSGTATGNGNQSTPRAMLKSKNVSSFDTIFTYQLTGGRTYRVSYTNCSATKPATCNLLSPDGKTMPADTMIECPDNKDYFFTLIIYRNGASDAYFDIENLSFKYYLVTDNRQGVTGTVYASGDCSFSGRQYPMGSSAPSSIYETITANGLNYGGNIPVISVSYGPYTQTCVNGGLEKYTPWTAFYSGTIFFKK